MLSLSVKWIIPFCFALVTSCGGGSSTPSSAPPPGGFSNPQKVTIVGYSGDAMEPFISRDGKYLFFNNSNDPAVDTNLYWALRQDDLTFQYQGQIGGVNTTSLDAVASMDRNNTFYFVSTRSYAQNASTIYRGSFANGTVSGVELAPGISTSTPGIVNFDAEISTDGNTLYFVEGQFNASGQPQTARILSAPKSGSGFIRSSGNATLLQSVNTGTLNYAPCTSPSELEIFFTRLDANGPAIYSATRASTSAPFGLATKVGAIVGFVEAPTLSPDQKSLYYHKMESTGFVIYRVTRP